MMPGSILINVLAGSMYSLPGEHCSAIICCPSDGCRESAPCTDSGFPQPCSGHRVCLLLGWRGRQHQLLAVAVAVAGRRGRPST
jgi:hypothetical protein